jgi:hypothetical protein
MKTVTAPTHEIGLANADGPKTETKTVIIAAGVATEIIDPGEKIPATGIADARMILLI